MEDGPSSFLLVIGDRRALSWILHEERTAFPEDRCQVANRLRPGDRLVLYTTRGCFGSPSVDRGRLIGTATVATKVVSLKVPAEFAGRVFGRGCALKIGPLARVRSGPEIAKMLDRLETFPQSWAVHLRRPLVPLDDNDYEACIAALESYTVDRVLALDGYRKQAERPSRIYRKK